MASKRPSSSTEQSSSHGPSKKKQQKTTFEPVQLGTICSLEDLDLKTLKFQNKKLAERIDQRRKTEEELRKRIEQLEQRQTSDDSVLMIVNRYWNTLDEDVRVLLQRFDAETTDEAENRNESTELTSFLMSLSSGDRHELEERLYQRVEFSMRAIRKLLQAFDRLLQRNDKLHAAITEKVEKSEAEERPAAGEASKDEKQADVTIKTEPVEEGDLKKEDKRDEAKKENTTSATVIKEEKSSEPDSEVKSEASTIPATDTKPDISLTHIVQTEMSELRLENRRVHNMITELHQKHHENTIKMIEMQDRLTAADTELAELRHKVEDLEYNLEKSEQRIQTYDRHLADAMKKIAQFEESGVIQMGDGKTVSGVSKAKFVEATTELEEQIELAQNRFIELENMSKKNSEAMKEIEKLQMDLKNLPESVIVETTEYKCLQSQFSVLYNESMQMKTQLEEARSLLQECKTEQYRQIEQMESDELENQKKLRTELIQLEDMLSQVRREYEMLRIEYEQTLAANEQTAPINREMRNLIQSLQSHNQQLKKDLARYKQRYKEAQNEITKLKAEGATTEGKSTMQSPPKSAPKEETIIIIRREEEEKEVDVKDKGRTEAEIIRDLKSQLKKAQDSQKELKLLLDMYKSAPKEQRDKVAMMANEKKMQGEIDDLKNYIRKMQESERKEKRKLADEDALRRIKKLEDTISELQKTHAAQKQREEALMNEMEVTGQAFEDMQEQNSRLVQQLREKDDANFKLMSERIKSSQIQNLLREEKEVFVEQVMSIQEQVNAQNLVVRKLEDKERILQTNFITAEKELGLRQQAMEMHKRKALESTQTAADLKLHLDKYQAQLKEAQQVVAEKTGGLEHEVFKYKRVQEEVANLQRIVERQKKIEMAGTADEVLMEEVKEYKEQLTCPSCKVKRKDAVLTKCFHVFCLECLKTRYETRQRKCPKCNAGFGANDYHRLYLT